MITLNLALDIAQFFVLLALSAANGVIAYSVLRIQRDRNTPKLVMYVDIVEDDDHDYNGLYVQNVGLVPALNVLVRADIEEWREGHPVRSKFHERYEEFADRHITLNPQEHRLYELPWMEGWALIVTVVASCSNGPGDDMHFVVGRDRSALSQTFSRQRRKKGHQKAEDESVIGKAGITGFDIRAGSHIPERLRRAIRRQIEECLMYFVFRLPYCKGTRSE